jgi:hypothetical protein
MSDPALPAVQPACSHRTRRDRDAYRVGCEYCLRYTITGAVVQEIAQARQQQLQDLRLACPSCLASRRGDVEECRLAIGLDTWAEAGASQGQRTERVS